MLNPETVSRTAVPRVRSVRRSLSLSFYLLLLSQLDGHVAALSLSIKRGRELFPRLIDLFLCFFKTNRGFSAEWISPLFLACLFFADSKRTNVRTFIRRSMTSENTFGGNESDSNPSCISGRVR